MLTVGFTYLAAFYLLLILCAVLYPDSLLGHCLRWSWLRWLGAIAYGTYLYHELVRSLFFGIFFGHLPIRMSWKEFCVSLIALLATLLLSRTSWLYFEKPLVDLGHRTGYQQRTQQRAGLMTRSVTNVRG